MRSGRHNRGAAVLQSEAQRVIDCSGGDFVVAGKAGENRKAGSVGASPRIGTLFVRKKIPDGSGSDVPGIAGDGGAEKFIEKTIRIVEDEDMAGSGAGIGIALHRRSYGNGHGTGVTLAAVGGEIHRDGWLLAADDEIRNADCGALKLTGSEIGMHADCVAD